jgi:hypothetical protein
MEAAMESAASSVGRLMERLTPLHATEKPVSFDPLQMALLQKLVRESTLQAGVAVRKEDFFKAVVYLDYFTEVIAGRGALLEDVEVIVEELERMHEYLDPDLVLLVRYSGLHVAKELKGEAIRSPSSLRQIRLRHQRSDMEVAAPAGGGELDLYHLALGRMVCSLVGTEAVRARLGGLRSRNALRAAILVDAVLAALPAAEVDETALESLRRGELLEAAVGLLAGLARACQGWSLREHVEEIRVRLDRPR